MSTTGVRADEPVLLPILCASPRGATMLQLPVVRQPLVSDRVFVLLARVETTPQGGIGMDWLMEAQYRAAGEPPLSELLEMAAGDLGRGLRVDGHATPDGDVAVVRRDGGMAGSALVMPNFYRRMSSVLGATRLVVGVPNHDELLVTDADRGSAGRVQQMTLDAKCPNCFLGPTVLLLEPAGVSLLSERGE